MKIADTLLCEECNLFWNFDFWFRRDTAHIRKMSKKAKSEKRRKTVTFPSLFRMSTFVDIFRHMSTDAENRFEFLRFQKYSKMPRQLLVICDRWYRHGAQFGIEMFMDKGSILPVVAARKRVRTTVRKRHLSDSQEE